MPELSCPRAPTVALQGQEADSARWVAATSEIDSQRPAQPEWGSAVLAESGDLWAMVTDLCRRIARQRADVSHAGGHCCGLAGRIWRWFPGRRAWAAPVGSHGA